MRPLLIIIALILGLYLFKVFYLDKKDNPPNSSIASSKSRMNSSAALPVDIYVAKMVNKNNVVYATGTIVPNEEVNIQSEVNGRLIQLNINEGGHIKKGQLIAKLDDSDLLAQLKKLKFEEELAQQIQVRQEKLLHINAISKEEYDMAVNKINTLSADREYLQVQLQKTSVRAPFSGKMGLKKISVGAYITPNVVITNLVQTNPIKLDFSLPEKYATKIKQGQNISFSVDGDDNSMIARVLAIDPQVDENLRTVNVRGKTSNNSGKLLPGMFVMVEIPLGEEESIMIPSKSIIPILKGKKVFIMKNGIAQEKEIKTGLRTDTDVQVEDGLVPGDSIIISALMTVKQGIKVSLRNVVL